MADTRLDRWIAALGTDATRRGVLGILVGAASFGGSEVAAKRRHRNRKGKGRVQAAATDKFEIFEVDDVFEDEFLSDECGFEVTHTVTGTVKASKDREGFSLSRFSLVHALIGPTGETLTFPDVGIDKVLAVAQAGENTVETVMATGVLALRIVIPGQGVVAANTGREIRTITFDENGDIVSFEVDVDSGLDRPLEGAALQAVCAALGPS